MKRKSLRIVIPILFALGITVLLLFQSSRSQTVSEEANQPDLLVSVMKDSVGLGKETFVKRYTTTRGKNLLTKRLRLSLHRS